MGTVRQIAKNHTLNQYKHFNSTDQVFYTTKDGTKVPMFMVRKKRVLPSLSSRPKKPIPVWIYGYGGFNKV